VHSLLNVLLIPFSDLLISVLDCSGTSTINPGSGAAAVSIQPSIECWKGMHIFYTTGSIISLLFLLSLCGFFSVFFFDGIRNEENVFGQ